MASKNNLVRDIVFFIKDDLLDNITDPIASTRSSDSKFVMTSYPKRKVQYPLITIKLIDFSAQRAGMHTTAQDITLELEIRVWAKNEKDKDELFTDVFNRLSDIQFTTGGSVETDLHDMNMVSGVEIEEDGDTGIKSRILGVNYRFYNV